MTSNHVIVHPLDPEDAKIVAAIRAASALRKGVLRGIEARAPFDAMMEAMKPRDDVRFENATIGGVAGFWVHPINARADEAIVHIHGGWFNLGSAKAARHLAAHLAARAGARAFVPDYRLAPEHPFPAAVDDVLAAYRGLADLGVRRTAITGDSAGGNLALVLAEQIAAEATFFKTVQVATVVLSPVTDLSLSGASYETRAEADPFFTRSQVSDLVRAYIGKTDPRNPLASPLHARLEGLPPVQVQVGDAEILLDDSGRFVDRAVAAGVDAALHLWMGMPHGFTGSIGTLNAASQALDIAGSFLRSKLLLAAGPNG